MLDKGYRGSSSEQARQYRQAGHDDAEIFAMLLGVDETYKNNLHAKKDVIDPSGDAHSVKSGRKKWQIFLYRRNRFETDDGFQALNGIGSLLIHCIDAFPPRYIDYEDNKQAAKERLRTPMRELKDRFQRKALLRAFLMKSIFNGGEVDYLTVLHENKFHVFRNRDVVQAFGDAFIVENSQAHHLGQTPEQKVVFRAHNASGRYVNIGELEMRNDSARHYQEVRFNMNKEPAVYVLLNRIQPKEQFNKEIFVYGHAISTFGRWPSQEP